MADEFIITVSVNESSTIIHVLKDNLIPYNCVSSKNFGNG